MPRSGVRCRAICLLLFVHACLQLYSTTLAITMKAPGSQGSPLGEMDSSSRGMGSLRGPDASLWRALSCILPAS